MTSLKTKKGHKMDYSIRLIAMMHHELNCKLNNVTALLQKERLINKALQRRIADLEVALHQHT